MVSVFQNELGHFHKLGMIPVSHPHPLNVILTGLRPNMPILKKSPKAILIQLVEMDI